MASQYYLFRGAGLSLISALCAGGAQAAPALTPYVGATIGVAGEGRLKAAGNDFMLGPFAVSEKVKQGWQGSGLVGAHLEGTPLSVEAEGLYVRNAVASPDLDAALGVPLSMTSRTKAALLNVKLAPATPRVVAGLQLRPYVAGGWGYGDSAVTILGDDYKGHGGMWQAKAGLEFPLSEQFTMDLGYRYLRLPSFHTNQLGLEADLKTHVQAISLGMRWTPAPR